jgi:hypothetical protein
MPALDTLQKFIKEPETLERDKKNVFHAIESGITSEDHALAETAAIAIATWQTKTGKQPEIEGDTPEMPKVNLENNILSGKTIPSEIAQDTFKNIETPLQFPGQVPISPEAVEAKEYEVAFNASEGNIGKPLEAHDKDIVNISGGEAPSQAPNLNKSLETENELFGVSKMLAGGLKGEIPLVQTGFEEAASVAQGQKGLEALEKLPQGKELSEKIDKKDFDPKLEDFVNGTIGVLSGKEPASSLTELAKPFGNQVPEGFSGMLLKATAFIMGVQHGMGAKEAGSMAKGLGEKQGNKKVAPMDFSQGDPNFLTNLFKKKNKKSEVELEEPEEKEEKPNLAEKALSFVGDLALKGIGMGLNALIPGLGTAAVFAIKAVQSLNQAATKGVVSMGKKSMGWMGKGAMLVAGAAGSIGSMLLGDEDKDKKKKEDPLQKAIDQPM